MKKNFLIGILFIIFGISVITLLLILNYLDPYENRIISLISILIAFLFSWVSFFTLCLYFFKRIYFRGEVYMNHLMISFRQWIFASLFIVWIVLFYSIGAPVFISGLLLSVILVLVELFMKNMDI